MLASNWGKAMRLTGTHASAWSKNVLHHSGKVGRGLGGSRAQPVCVVGEQNVLFNEQNTHKAESILVHEFAHNVMNIGFDKQMKVRIDSVACTLRCTV